MALREFTGRDGALVMVWDVQPSAGGATNRVAAGYGAGWLCFQCEYAKRRILGIPPAWEMLSDGALEALWGQAEPVATKSQAR